MLEEGEMGIGEPPYYKRQAPKGIPDQTWLHLDGGGGGRVWDRGGGAHGNSIHWRELPITAQLQLLLTTSTSLDF